MVQNLKIILITAASAFVSAYAVDRVNNNKLDVSQQNIADLNAKLVTLQKQNEQLASLLNSKTAIQATTSNTTIKTQPRPSAHTQPTEQANESAPVKPLQDDQLLHTSENFSKWLANASKEKTNFNLHEQMQRRFDAETVDHNWAEAQEQEYLKLFSQNPELAGIALRETQCRTQQCALTISISDINQANELMEKMTKTLQQKKQYPMIIATPDEQRGITTLYIGKDADSFEFN